MRAEINSPNEEKRKIEIKVRDGIAEAWMEEKDRSPTRLVALSIGNTREPGSGNQHTVAPAGEVTNHQIRPNAPEEKDEKQNEHEDFKIIKLSQNLPPFGVLKTLESCPVFLLCRYSYHHSLLFL